MTDGFVPYQPDDVSPEDGFRQVRAFRERMDGRRTVRMFDPNRPVPRETIEEILTVAGSAPSGAHKQPWTFAVVSSAEVKQNIRKATEEQENEFYDSVITDEWRADLAPLGTDFQKEHITEAPWLIIVYAQDYELHADGSKSKHYYVTESVGIACGFLLAAIREAGLVALTHTPSPMKYLQELLGRPANERTFLVIPVGYPHPECVVPDLARKSLPEFTTWH
jgi:iodotyrosine deiodinase